MKEIAKSDKPLVGIIMGSDSDFEVMVEAARALKEFGVSYEVIVSSAHRSPERTAQYSRSARERGMKAMIVGAGAAAHLAGVVAAETTLPVIGVPIHSSVLKGLDALLATVQMPGGVPVATMAIGKPGARNAGIFVTQLLAADDAELAARLDQYKKDLAAGVLAKSEALKKRIEEEGL